MTVGSKSSPCAAPDGSRAVEKSKATPRRAVVLILVHVVIAAHIAHWWTTGRSVSPLEPSEAMEFAKHSVVNAGLVFFVLMIVSTAVLGRFFCGWGCHLVALQDLCRGLMLKLGVKPRPLRSKLLALVPLGAFVYMFLWPFAYRLWIGDDLSLRPNALVTEKFWATFPGAVVAIFTLAACGFGAVYLLGSKGFCTYACPYGAIFGVADRVAPGRIRVTDACEGCGHCTITCSSNVQVAQEVRDFGMVVDPGCMKCLDCVSVCPKEALYFGLGRPSLRAKPRSEPRRRKAELTWREEALVAGLFLVGLFVFRGLYGMIPFLFALGIASCAAFLGLRMVQLFSRRAVRLQSIDLKSEGQWRPAGRVYALCFGVFGVFWLHSGFVQYHGWRSERAFEELAETRSNWFSSERPALSEDVREAAGRVIEHAGFVRDWGLRPSGIREIESAWAALVLGEEDGFRIGLERAAEILPRAATPLYELAHHERAAGRGDAAIDYYYRAVAADPESIEAWRGLVSLVPREKVGELVDAMGDAVARAPTNPALRRLRATVAVAAGDTDVARQEYEASLELEPSLFLVRAEYADLLMDLGDRDACIALLEAGVEEAPGDPAPLRVLALTHLLLGELGPAEEICRRALELPAGRDESQRLLDRILTETEDR